MMGAAINVIPFMIQRNVPGIGPYVLPAYLFAAVPAIFAALAYAILASAMPRAGGSYIYASRALNPYLGFAASFSQWFGLCIAIGVVSYVLIPFLRDIAGALSLRVVADTLDAPPIRVLLAMAFLWTFVAVNLRGVRLYEKILIPLMFLMFALGAVVIIAGFSSGQQDFAAALLRRDGQIIPTSGPVPFRLPLFFAASALLFASFIGFDSIAQAGGEARNPGRSLPMAIGIAVVTVGTFYVLFTAAVYHAVPWAYIAEEGLSRDLTAPGLLGYLLPAGWTVAIVGGAAVALINDLPAMLLAVSRLIFAWGEDGVFPNSVARVHPKWHTPHLAILLSGPLATLGILGNFLANDFFLGVDILVISMLVNFLLICLSVLVFPHRNPELAGHIRVVKSRKAQVVLGFVGVVMLGGFLVIPVWKDLTTSLRAWYFHSTYIYLIVMALASAIYVREVRKLRRRGVDVKALFSNLPPE